MVSVQQPQWKVAALPSAASPTHLLIPGLLGSTGCKRPRLAAPAPPQRPRPPAKTPRSTPPLLLLPAPPTLHPALRCRLRSQWPSLLRPLSPVIYELPSMVQDKWVAVRYSAVQSSPTAGSCVRKCALRSLTSHVHPSPGQWVVWDECPQALAAASPPLCTALVYCPGTALARPCASAGCSPSCAARGPRSTTRSSFGVTTRGARLDGWAGGQAGRPGGRLGGCTLGECEWV